METNDTIIEKMAYGCVFNEVLCEFLCYHEDEIDRLLMGKERYWLNSVCADIG